MKPKRSAQRAALIKRELDRVAGYPTTPPRVYIAPTRTMIRGENPTTFSTGPLRLCQPHGQPAKWCLVCARQRGY